MKLVEKLNVNKKQMYFRIGLTILWMMVIFMLSSQNSDTSSSTSGRILALISQIIHYDLLTSPFVNMCQFIVRKCAHMFAYFLLGILWYRVFVLIKNHPYRWSALCTVLYACSDEFHQLFVPGRAGQIRDVCIDSMGMLIGFIGIYFVKRIRGK